MIRRGAPTLAGQIVGVAYVVHGIDLISKPAAFIFGGLVAVVSLELRGRK